MILNIANVLNESKLHLLVKELRQSTFIEGSLTAGWHARLVKKNTQLKDRNSPKNQALQKIVIQALEQNILIQMAVLPKRIQPILFSRYEVGMSYGSHVDDAIMGKSTDMMRSDISATLFLSDPDSYRGGELVIETSQGEESFKLAAGSIIIYPSTSLHRVEPITQGVRLAAVTWMQSLVRDAGKREILFDLDTVRRLIFEQEGKSHQFDLISKSYANLLRLWVDI